MNPIVAISGTSRPDNYTSHALAVVVDELRAQGSEVEIFDARTLTLAFPGHPVTDDAKRLQEAVRGCTAVVLATPEYHGSFAAMTKLILESMGFPSALAEKPVALLGVAAGRIGAIKSVEQLRGVCAHTGAVVLPGSVSVAGVQAAFSPSGECLDADTEKSLRALAKSLLEFVKDYVCPRYVLETLVRGDGEAWTANL
jgi:chromate reductase, NAD(P)H dehydrogenase (quinone)